MKVFAVVGYSDSGKTQTLVEIIKELAKRGYIVNSVKNVHIEGFSIETEGKDSWRHRKAGAIATAIRADSETTIMIKKSLSVRELIPYFKGDYLVLEGFAEEKFIPKILCASSLKDLEERFDKTVFVISGRISEEIVDFKGIKAINGLTHIKELVDLVEQKAINRQKLIN